LQRGIARRHARKQAEHDRLVERQRAHPLRVAQRDLQRDGATIRMPDEVDTVRHPRPAAPHHGRRIDIQAAARVRRPGRAAAMAVQIRRQHRPARRERVAQRAPLRVAAGARVQAHDGRAAGLVVALKGKEAAVLRIGDVRERHGGSIDR